MIELSKCPNCAEEDRVTIAGKEFCMRCGTPAEDNAKMGVAEQPAVAQDHQQSAEQNQAGGVSKFNAAPAGQLAQQPISANPSDVDMAQATNQAAQMPEVDQQKAQLENQINNLSTQAPLEPMPTSQTETAMQQPAQPKPYNPPPGAVKKVAEQTAPVAAPEPISQPAAPVNIAIASDAVVPPVAPRANTQPAQGSMSLDKHTGVLSDDQFDQLRDSVAAPSVLGSPVSEEPVQAHQEPKPVVAPPVSRSNDIYSAHGTGESAQPSAPTPAEASASTPTKPAKHTKKKKGLKPAGIVVSIIALFMVGAYVWKVNYSNLAFKVASSKAGMSASMPGYVPAGFNLSGDIRTNPGTVSYSLVNSSANKNITISQTKTDWDSQALAENYVAPKSENYLALQAQGLTIYVLGNNQATWINKGTWYRIESTDKALTQDQIIKIATSL
jgi:hypothetical protein